MSSARVALCGGAAALRCALLWVGVVRCIVAVWCTLHGVIIYYFYFAWGKKRSRQQRAMFLVEYHRFAVRFEVARRYVTKVDTLFCSFAVIDADSGLGRIMKDMYPDAADCSACCSFPVLLCCECVMLNQ